MPKRKNKTGSKFNHKWYFIQNNTSKDFNVAKMDKLKVYGKPSEESHKVITSFGAQTYNLQLPLLLFLYTF